MVSDFYLPSVGGIEMHIYHLSLALMRRGVRVVVVTHEYGDHRGLETTVDGLRIYYLPIPMLPTTNASLPTFFTAHHLLRGVFIRENVDIVHAHGALSSLGHEALMHARWINNTRTIFTDHSLFAFRDVTGILTNKLLRFALCDVDGVICVSHSGKENTQLRARLEEQVMHVIPNAIISSDFLPRLHTQKKDKKITIVTISRLFYRKGIDLLIAAAPIICARYPAVHFIVGGDGPLMTDLERMTERHGLQERVEILGNVPPQSVSQVMQRGDIYLNTSLTESFGIVLLEAASTGLHVVSTKVGGIPEVLPEGMVEYCEEVSDVAVVNAIERTLEAVASLTPSQEDARKLHNHDAVRRLYSWDKVAEMTHAVYTDSLAKSRPQGVYYRLSKAVKTGCIGGVIYAIVVLVDAMIAVVLGVLGC